MQIEYGNIDFDKDVEDLKAMPKDDYVMAVFAHTLKLKDNDPNRPFIEWQLLVKEGKYKGRKLTHNTSLQVDSLPYLKRFLKACGFGWGKKFNPNDNCVDVYGCEVIGHVNVRMWEGEERNNITGFIALK